MRRYGASLLQSAKDWKQEFRLIRKYKLAGFLLLYHEVIKLGREVMIEQGLSDPSLTLEENPPGEGAALRYLYWSVILSGFPILTR